MASLQSIVNLIHPSNNEAGVVLGDRIWVLFDREMDETSLGIGHFFAEGPSQHIQSGPDLLLHVNDPLSLVNDSDIFDTSGYKDIVKGAVSFERINLLDTGGSSATDTTGAGNLFRTKVIFTPETTLRQDTKYNVYLVGKEGTFDDGVRSRTVFDTVVGGSNTGNGKATFGGGYTGGATDTYRIEITTAGIEGVARFKWYKDSSPLLVTDNVLVDTDQQVKLSQGVYIDFIKGQYNLSDKWTVVVKTATFFETTFRWSFQTGSGSIIAVPTATATSVIGTAIQAVTSGIDFAVTGFTPAHRKVQVDPFLKEITVTFNNTIDANTVISDSVLVVASPANGDEELLATKNVPVNLVVDNNILRIKLV